MCVLTFSEARANFKQAIDDVCNHHKPTIIKRTHGDDAVLMSLEDFESLQETLYLLGSTTNSSRLMASIGELNAGKAQIRNLTSEYSETKDL